MSDTVIKVENLSKQYRLGEMGTGTISHDLNRWWHKVRGKEDPYLKIGEVNDRTTKGSSDYVWAMRDVNFEVKRGEVLGIIGKNGAGKSTLLKLLSRVTSPTTGRIRTKGRIASLLEVGTGFHDELTGRENIFLNGAIMGMTKAETREKLDEIIAFSGTERYIDTPVKRYSSGMRVRLGFAVAAHLEPEILIVDEVLAVGDAEFQKKAIGKMQEVSHGGGRTVLFVSHNMAAVKSLCTSGILLLQGKVESSGNIDDIVDLYNKTDFEGVRRGSFSLGNKENNFCFLEIDCRGSDGVSKVDFNADENVEVSIVFYNPEKVKGARIVLQVLNMDGITVFATTDHNVSPLEWEKGIQSRKCLIRKDLLKKGTYFIKIHAGIPGVKILIEPVTYVQFSIIDSVHGSIFLENWPGIIAPKLEWEVNNSVRSYYKGLDLV